VIRDQDDLRAIFERKMQERQEFIDRYFVFNEARAWEPPRDWTRTNGLVEEIRQSILKEEERTRLAEESRPKGPVEHTPVEPIGMPSFGARASDAGGAAATPVGGVQRGGVGPEDESSPMPPATPTPPRMRPPRIRNQGARPQPEQVE
jgi:general secretion pathway protein D